MRIAALLLLAACVREAPDDVPAPPGIGKRATAIACKPPPAPETVALPSKATAVAARQAHACALLDTGRVWCWGENEFEQAGSAQRASETAPHDIGLANVVAISLGWSSGCARHADGTTTCWGRKTSWNLDLPQSLAARPPSGRRVAQVSAGKDHTCAIVGGTVECYGLLGNFSGFPPAEPRVPGVASATAIAAGDDEDCALASGAIACWGRPHQFSCDDRCERDKRRPVAHRVTAIADATAIAVGSFDACALRKSGRVVCWGAVNGAREGTAAIVPIPDLFDAHQISVGPYHACAVRASGAIAAGARATPRRTATSRRRRSRESPTRLRSPPEAR